MTQRADSDLRIQAPAQLGLDQGWLVIFDRRPDQPPIAERTSSEPARSPRGRAIQIIRA